MISHKHCGIFMKIFLRKSEERCGSWLQPVAGVWRHTEQRQSPILYAF